MCLEPMTVLTVFDGALAYIDDETILACQHIDSTTGLLQFLVAVEGFGLDRTVYAEECLQSFYCGNDLAH
jgi:hypothetical protein